MISSFFHNKLVIVLIIIVVAAGGWYGLSSSSASVPVLSSTPADTSGDSSIVSNLLQLQAITLNGAILTNPAFTSLKDFTTAIVPEPVGRADPFASLSVGATVTTGTASASAPSAKIFQPATH